MATTDQLVAISRHHQTQQVGIADRTARQVGLAWDRYGGVDDTAVRRFTSIAERILLAALAQTDALSIGYIDVYLAAGGLRPPRRDTGGISYPRPGVDLIDVYTRPIITARAALARGDKFDRAMQIARTRAVETADQDVMLTARASTTNAMRSAPAIVGYRRVPDSGACDFCLVAATQRYHVEQLMPLHGRCHCDIAPIIGTQDPGRVIDKDALRRLKTSAGEAPATTVHEHGELGPVLYDARWTFATA